jgi:hypothetical protein
MGKMTVECKGVVGTVALNSKLIERVEMADMSRMVEGEVERYLEERVV